MGKNSFYNIDYLNVGIHYFAVFGKHVREKFQILNI